MTEYQISSDINERAQQREAELDTPAVKVRDQAREKALWDHYIQPVVNNYFKGKYQYKYFEEPAIITNRDIDSMLRTTMALCKDGYDLIFPTDYFEKHVLRPLRNGITTYTRNKEYGSVDLKELFEGFLGDLFDDKTLPIYLSFLDLEYGSEGLWGPTSSDSDQGQESTGASVSESLTVSDNNKQNADIDYSGKSKEEQKELANRWFEEKKSRRDIAILLYPQEYKQNPDCIQTLLKRVDRLRGTAG